MKKEALLAIHRAAGCVEPATLLASGNVIFTHKERNLEKLASRIEAEFERTAGFYSEAILRNVDDLQLVKESNPFAGRDDRADPAKLIVTFLASPPTPAAMAAALAIPVAPEEMRIIGRELYIYFPEGMGKSKFPAAKVTKALGGIPGTGRNWNTVLKLLDLAAARR